MQELLGEENRQPAALKTKKLKTEKKEQRKPTEEEKASSSVVAMMAIWRDCHGKDTDSHMTLWGIGGKTRVEIATE